MLNEIEFFLEDLKSKFTKINPSDYYLSYSGGRDSHFLYWFIKDYLKDNKIEIVSINTQMEIPEIRKRMQENADKILYPVLKHFEIKEKYGIPCFTKNQDELIYRYRKCKEKNHEITKQLIKLVVNSKETTDFFRISNLAHDLLFSGNLHKVSHLCCKYLKKEPSINYEKLSGKKPIIGIMHIESLRRSSNFKTCFNKQGYFYPILDLTKDLQEKIEKEYEIPVPSVYNFIDRTGCAACPYGIKSKETSFELDILPNKQREFVLEYFKESYAARNFVYQYKLDLNK
jgi:3'-phosphoadenosine 5'-phosphosulfate sulfotransferase (PAPS reductase)/FAD synthetase